jgi:hypothetical protein
VDTEALYLALKDKKIGGAIEGFVQGKPKNIIYSSIK